MLMRLFRRWWLTLLAMGVTVAVAALCGVFVWWVAVRYDPIPRCPGQSTNGRVSFSGTLRRIDTTGPDSPELKQLDNGPIDDIVIRDASGGTCTAFLRASDGYAGGFNVKVGTRLTVFGRSDAAGVGLDGPYPESFYLQRWTVP
jgi:hypothetical protein